jgi:anti-sigma-K factor RskA
VSDLHTLSGAYALDAVDDIERAAFARHLEECPGCAQEVAELTGTAARLADATTVAPPARLRERVLDEIARTRQLGPLLPGPPPGRRLPGAPRRWRRAIGAVAAAVVLLGGGGGAAVEEHRVRVAQRQAARAAEIEAVLAAPDTVVRMLTGPDGTGRFTLVMSASRNEALAVFGGLESPGVDRTYQLWTVRGTQAIDEGSLGTGATDGSVLVEGVRDAQAFAVSNEPAGGSPAPTQVELSMPLT